MKFFKITSLVTFMGLSLGQTPLMGKEQSSSAAGRDKDVNTVMTLNANIWKGRWHEIKGRIKEKWAQLTDDDLLEIEGNQEKLKGIVEKRYGIEQEQAKKNVDAFYEDLNKHLKIQKKDVNMYITLNPNIWKGRWHKIKGAAKKQWGKLTDDDLLQIEGDQEKLRGIVQKRYGVDQERAAQEVNQFYQDLSKDLESD